MKTLKQIVLTILSVGILASMAACGGGASLAKADTFKETDGIVDKYFGAIAAGKSDEAYGYEYTGVSYDTKETRPRFWIDSVKDYTVNEKEKVNDNLFVYTMLLASSDNLDLYKKLYFYIVKIDGKLYVADASQIIPDKLKDGFDAGKYVYADPNMHIASPG